MPAPRIVVIGGSSGAIEALRTIVRALPENLPAPVCVVVHTSPQAPGMLDAILSRSGVLPAENAVDGGRVEPGRIYVAPPDHHLLLEPGALRLSHGPKENRFRPAIDPLFRAAAQIYGPGAVGVILSGNLDDGTAGLRAIAQLGGTTVVQDPADALFPSMPQSALSHVAADHVVAARDVAPLLVRILETPLEKTVHPVPLPPALEVEVKIAREDDPLDAGLLQIADPSPFACPECHGVLLRLKEADPMRFRCHTGHAYTADSLIAALNESIEDSLWNAVRALHEGTLLLRHLARHSSERGDHYAAEKIAEQLASTSAQAEAVRDVVTNRTGLLATSNMRRNK